MTTESDAQNSVVITRTLAAPVDLVWDMWTDPDHFKSWYGPQGASIPVADLDVREGGRRLICMEMQTPNGPMQMWFTGEFRTVDRTDRLVYTDAMSDSEGNVLSPESMGMPEGHPAETEVIVELATSDAGTDMTMTHVGVPADSPGAMGWNMAIDKLTEYVATRA